MADKKQNITFGKSSFGPIYDLGKWTKSKWASLDHGKNSIMVPMFQLNGLINKTHVIVPKETIKTAIDSLDGAYKFLAIHGLKELHPRTAQMLDDFRAMIKEKV